MPDTSTFARGQDVAGDNQPHSLMRYQEWAALGFCYGWVQYVRSGRVIRDAAEHRAKMRAAGYLTGAYAAIAHGDLEGQARTFLSLAPDDDELPDMLDVESQGLTEADVRAWCDFHDANSNRPLVIYTRKGFWEAIVPAAAAERYARYELVIAGYPFDAPSDRDKPFDNQPMDAASIARRSTPPARFIDDLPRPWTLDKVLSWQHTGHGSLPGHDAFLDLQVARITAAELRRRFLGGGPASGRRAPDVTGTTTTPTVTPVTTDTTPVVVAADTAATPAVARPLIARGTKLAVGQVQNGPALQFVRQAHAAGARLAGALGVDNAGIAMDARELVPFRITRFVQDATDAAPGMDDVPSDEALREMARRQVDPYVHRLNAEEKAGLTFIVPWNEPRPHTIAGYLALTRLMFFTADACEANGFRFLAYAFNAGTPEWDEALAMWRTGINARLLAGGHGISIHLGVLASPGARDRLDDSILGTSITNPFTGAASPFLPNADPLVLRHRFLKAAADEAGVALAPLFATEVYPSIRPVRDCDPADIVERYRWLDGQVAQDAYFCALFPYSLGSAGTGMPEADHAAVWPGLVQHAIDVKDRVNAADAGGLNWWEAFPSGLISPKRRLPTPTRMIPMRDETGVPFSGVMRQNGMEARERRGDLFRVLDEPIDGQMWWVKAQDLPAP